MSVVSFDIEFDNRNVVYHEGDWVSGNVVVINTEEIKYKAVKLELCGIAIVQWNQGDESDLDIDPDDIKGDINKEQYFHKSVTLLEKDSSKDAEVLEDGEHFYPFDCKLPPELPSSFEGRFGQVRYMARAWIERIGKKTKVITRKAFTVLNGLNLNFIPECAAKIELCKYKQLGSCCVSGSVTVDWAVNRSGFVPGQDIWINGSVQNDSKEIVAFSRVALYMVVDYKSKKRHKRERRKIASVDKGETLSDDVCIWHDPLHIPPVPPTGLGRCRMININYEIEFKLLVEGGYSPVHFVKDIYIGTVPVSHKEMKSCVAGMFNQPYVESYENLDRLSFTKRQSEVSLTQIIALEASENHTHSPTAPTLATFDRDATPVRTVCMSPSGDGGQEAGVGERRPPPFAPGHHQVQIIPPPPSAACGTVEDEVDGSQQQPDTPASAPGINTLLRPWPESPLYPMFETTDMFGPVSLRESGDEQASVHGELTYHPVYPYYPTLRGADPKNQPES